MTNAELIAALRNCARLNGTCVSCEYADRTVCKWDMMRDAADAIEKLMAERKQPDEIVKCRECRFYDNGTCLSPKTTYTELRREDWYCADGKRKEQI